MKGTGGGLIIEDDSPRNKKGQQGKGKNPFSFFAASGGSAAAAANAKAPNGGASSATAAAAGGTTRAPAPYSIFDEPASATSPPTQPKTAKATTGARPAHHAVGGAPPPSIFDEPHTAPRPKRGMSTTVPAQAVPQPVFDVGDGFDLMKERLAEQEKLKRKAKEQQQTTSTAGGGVAASRSASTTAQKKKAAPASAKSKQKDNPFSFKNFASRGDEEKDMEDDGDEDEGIRGVGGEDDDDDEEEEQLRPGENPFSFKAFAKKSGDGKTQQQQQQRPVKNTMAPVLPSLSGDEEEEVTSVGSDRRRTKKANPYSFTPQAPSLPLSSTKATSLPLPAISDSEDEDQGDNDDAGIPSLPALDATETPDLDVPDFSVEAESRSRDDGAEARLSAQVRELKALLLRAEANAEEERKRASAIERRALKAEKAQARLRKKEEDDTKQLNDVVQAIEHNLMLATARAEKAEAKVQQLEDQVARCSCGRNPGVHGDSAEAQQQLRTIHEQSTYLTSQLHKAANDAEAGIKKLIGGVATLRDIATVLQSIDKMSHVPSS